MPRTPEQVAGWAKNQKDRRTNGWRGYCLKFSRMAAGAPGGTYDAVTAWKQAKYRHSTGTPPRGSFVFWSGGRSGHGHIAVSAGGGDVYSTDLHTSDYVGRVPISLVHQRWGLKYLGWTEDVNRVRIEGLVKPKKPRAPEWAGVNGDGKVTIAGKVYDDIGLLYPSSVNQARESGNRSRAVFRVQVWLRELGYWPKGGLDGQALDGRWFTKSRPASVMQDAVDRFRWDHRDALGITEKQDAGGTVGYYSLSLMRKLVKTPNYPIKKES